jgi:hypothetical protein
MSRITWPHSAPHLYIGGRVVGVRNVEIDGLPVQRLHPRRRWCVGRGLLRCREYDTVCQRWRIWRHGVGMPCSTAWHIDAASDAVAF